MRLQLKLHPDTRCEAVSQLEVKAQRDRDGWLQLHYLITGGTGLVAMPQWQAPGRADGLWKHTCFEAFVRPMPDPAYYEFNFSPSQQWAGYLFRGYREGMTPAHTSPPPIAMSAEGQGMGIQRFELSTSVDLSALPKDRPWRVGLSAVIEEQDGRISYWALEHPPGKPDFHHQDCFALELPAPSAS
jgi:hypothetical protein